MKTLIIPIILLILPHLSKVNANEESCETYIATANQLEQQKNPHIARKILKVGYTSTQKMDILFHWFSLDQAWLSQLKSKQKKTVLTSWRTAFEEKCLSDGDYHWDCSEQNRQMELNYQESNPIPIIDIKEVRAVLYEYNQLKTSLSEIKAILSDKLLDVSEQDIQSVFAFSKKPLSLFDKAKQIRSHYLSFDVVSPYLARIEQLLFIARISKPHSSFLKFVPLYPIKKLYSQEKIQQAANLLAQVGNNDIILDTTASVRTDFLRIYQKFETIVGQNQFDNLKKIEILAYQLKHNQFYKLGVERW